MVMVSSTCPMERAEMAISKREAVSQGIGDDVQ